MVKPRFNRQCSNCGTQTTVIKKAGDGHEFFAWYKDGKGGHRCLKCNERIRYQHRKQYFKEIANPRTHAKWNKHRINVKGIDRHYDMRINRKGKCLFCKKTISSGRIRRTNLAHIEYKDDQLDSTIELCVACHTRLDKNRICIVKWFKYEIMYQH